MILAIALVGNKIDLIEREVIDYNEGSTYAKVDLLTYYRAFYKILKIGIRGSF